MTEQLETKEEMKPYEFPRETLTYFYFLPDINNIPYVERIESGRTHIYATVVIDGHLPIREDSSADDSEYVQVTNFQTELVRFTPTLWNKIQEILAEHENYYNPVASVCIGLLVRKVKGRVQYTPFVATEQHSNKPLLTNLVERCGETTILTAIANATTMLFPEVEIAPTKTKHESTSERRTELLTNLLDNANLLPLDQLETLVRIVQITNNGRYKIRLRPEDMYLPHIGQTGGA